MDYDFANVKDGKVYDASGNDYDGKITGAKTKKRKCKTWLALDGKGKVETGLRSMDYPYTVQFDLKLPKDAKTKGDICLFLLAKGRTFNNQGKWKLRTESFSYFNQDF